MRIIIMSSSAVVVMAGGMMAMSVVALALALVLQGPRRQQQQQQQQPQPQQPEPKRPKQPKQPKQPTQPEPPAQQTRGGKALGEGCKITGDVYSARGAKAGGIRRTNVRATYHTYSPHYDTGTLACADVFWGWKDYGKKLMQYPWFAYCLGGRDTWNPAKTCGRCFRVTNRATGASIIGRAVDSGGCPGGTQDGIDADPCLFNAIDTDGSGVRDGNLMVDVEEVDC